MVEQREQLMPQSFALSTSRSFAIRLERERDLVASHRLEPPRLIQGERLVNASLRVVYEEDSTVPRAG